MDTEWRPDCPWEVPADLLLLKDLLHERLSGRLVLVAFLKGKRCHCGGLVGQCGFEHRLKAGHRQRLDLMGLLPGRGGGIMAVGE